MKPTEGRKQGKKKRKGFLLWFKPKFVGTDSHQRIYTGH
jgi:hypothetical protein